MKTGEIQMRDPFILPVAEKGTYYLFGTTDSDCWRGAGIGFDVYTGTDLAEWTGPVPAFRPEGDFWGKKNFWAPEAHLYRGRYYLFASFIAEGYLRGTQSLVSDKPEGPYRPCSSGALTPSDWQCLDGTLFVDDDGMPWLIFCHEWVQVRDGEICAIPLSADLREAAGKPVLLFKGSEAPWTKPHRRKDGSVDLQSRVTDGPFAYRHSSGSLLLLWSSFTESGYAIGIARSASGSVTGPWVQEESPLLDSDAGHGMLFRSFGGELFLALHSPNETPKERPVFIPLRETESGLCPASGGGNGDHDGQ